MLVVAGYLNYTTTNDLNSAIQTSSSEEELAQMAITIKKTYLRFQ